MVVAEASRSTTHAEAAVVDVFDAIGSDWFGEGVTPKSIARALIDAGDRDVLVRVNSPGGDMFDGMAIYNMLRALGDRLTVEVVGLAASVASMIALAGHRVRMHSTAMMMIHNPWSLAVGDGNAMREAAEFLDKVRGLSLTIYEANSNASRDELIAMLDAETWLTADEALELGFVDEVVHVREAEPAPAAAAAARVSHVLAKFQHTPAAVCARYGGRRAAATSKKRSIPMEREEILAALGLTADASAEQVKAAVQGPKAPAAAAPVDLSSFVPRADYDALRSSLAAREQAERERERRTFEARVEATVDAAVKAGKIPPVSADYHRSTCLSGGAAALDAFASYIDKAPEIAGGDQMRRAEGRETTTPVAASDRKLLARLGVTPDELEKTRAEMRSKPEIYPEEAYPLV